MQPKEQNNGGNGAPPRGKGMDARLVDYLYDELEPQALQAFQKRMAQDEALEAQVAAYKNILGLCRAELTDQAPSPPIKGRILGAAGEDADRRATFWSRLASVLLAPQRRYALGMAVSLLLVCGAVMASYYFKGVSRDGRHHGKKPSSAPTVADRKRPAIDRKRRRALRKQHTLAERRKAEQKAPAAPESTDETDAEPLVATAEQVPGSGRASNAPHSRRRVRGRTGRTTFGFMGEKPKEGELNDGLSADRPIAPRGADTVMSRTVRGGGKGGLGSMSRGNQPAADGDRGSEDRDDASRKSNPSYRRALALQRAGKHRQASRLFSSLARNKSVRNHSKLLFRWAQSELALGRYKKARMLLDAVNRRSSAYRARVAQMKHKIRKRQKKSTRKQKTK